MGLSAIRSLSHCRKCQPSSWIWRTFKFKYRAKSHTDNYDISETNPTLYSEKQNPSLWSGVFLFGFLFEWIVVNELIRFGLDFANFTASIAVLSHWDYSKRLGPEWRFGWLSKMCMMRVLSNSELVSKWIFTFEMVADSIVLENMRSDAIFL